VFVLHVQILLQPVHQVAVVQYAYQDFTWHQPQQVHVQPVQLDLCYVQDPQLYKLVCQDIIQLPQELMGLMLHVFYVMQLQVQPNLHLVQAKVMFIHVI